MLKRAKEVAGFIRDAQQVHIVTHIDADGIAAGAIALQTLNRLHTPSSIEFIKQLDESSLRQLEKKQYDLVWFTDLGSSTAVHPIDFPKVITDHHTCHQESNLPFHLNPHLFDIDGTHQLSGAGVTYLVARAVDRNNSDLSSLAIVGACGDLQDRATCRLEGYNRMILEDAEKSHVLSTILDIRFFGRETRPLYKFLRYATDPVLPGLSGREASCISFLEETGIRLKEKETWRRWIHLNTEERQIILSALAQLLLTKGFDYKITQRIIGEVYIFVQETEGTELHDAKEFATLLNSTARYGQCQVGLNICLGDRKEAFRQARTLLQGHRQNLVEALQFAREEGIEKREYLQFFHAGSGIRDTIIGIVTNMLLQSEDVNPDVPLVGFVDKGEGEIKASARGTHRLINKGLDLASALRKSAEHVNGIGGGHNIAAGATIPKGREEEFLSVLETEIKHQLSSSDVL